MIKLGNDALNYFYLTVPELEEGDFDGLEGKLLFIWTG